MSRVIAGVFAASCLALLVVMGMFAPEHLAQPDLSMAYASPGELPPFGADNRGRPLLEYAQQGAQVVALPAMLGGLVVLLFGTLGGLLACVGSGRVQAAVQGFGEVVGALPRLVVVLGRGLASAPRHARSHADRAHLGPARRARAPWTRPRLWPVGWAARGLSRPCAPTASPALGFTSTTSSLLNLRPVVVRQAIETVMQVVFLEIALSYLALSDSQPSFTHNDSVRSWADILYLGYQVILDVETGHALALGLGLVGVVALMSLSVTWAVRAR
jgi:ABC-type dipeptide/oligopeptide/nickel transport system permease subunit